MAIFGNLGSINVGPVQAQAQALLAAMAAAAAAGQPSDIASVIAANPGAYGAFIPLLISRFGPAWTQNLLNVIGGAGGVAAGKLPTITPPTPVSPPVRPIPSDIGPVPMPPGGWPVAPPVNPGIMPSSPGQVPVPLGGQYPQRRVPSEIPPHYYPPGPTPTPTGGELAGRLPTATDTGQVARLRRILGLTAAMQGIRAGMR
jgi:hypothetical protein